jgi:hypothetical protein
MFSLYNFSTLFSMILWKIKEFQTKSLDLPAACKDIRYETEGMGSLEYWPTGRKERFHDMKA